MRRVIVAGDDRHVRGTCRVTKELSPRVRNEYCRAVIRVTGELAQEAARAFARGEIDDGWQVGNEARSLFAMQNCCRGYGGRYDR